MSNSIKNKTLVFNITASIVHKVRFNGCILEFLFVKRDFKKEDSTSSGFSLGLLALMLIVATSHESFYIL